MRRFHILFILWFFSVVLLLSKPAEAANAFNALSLAKMEVEQRFGVTNLECFPFLTNIGSNSDEAERVRQCQVGVTTLASALKEVSKCWPKAHCGDQFPVPA